MSTVTNFDVIVIGAGPAGSSAALNLARAGVNVALIDKAAFPRHKTCGGGLVRRAVNFLPFDIDPVVEKNCTSIECNLLESQLRYEVNGEEPLILMTMRDDFDHYLISRAEEAGAKVITGCEVGHIQRNSRSILVETNKNSFTAQYVIAADGALGRVARKDGWQETRKLIPALECEVYVDDATYDRLSGTARFDFELVPDGYAWVFPKKEHLSIGVLSMNTSNARLGDYLNRYLDILKISSSANIRRHGYVIPVHPRKGEFVQDRILPIRARLFRLYGNMLIKKMVRVFTGEESYNDLFKVTKKYLKTLP